MKFAYTIVYVADVAASLAFYQRAFKLPVRFLHESGMYGELDTGATTLAFAHHAMGDSLGHQHVRSSRDAAPLGIELALSTTDVLRAYEHAISEGATPLTPPEEKPWGQTVAYVRGLDGELIELCTPMGE